MSRRRAFAHGRLGLVGFAGLTVGLVLALIGIFQDSPWVTASGIGTIQVGVLWLIVGLERTQTPLAHPLMLWTIPIIFGTVLRPWWFLGQSDLVQSEFLAYAPLSVITEGTVASCLFFVAALVGYGLRRRQPGPIDSRPALPSIVDVRMMAVVAMAVAVLGLLLFTNAAGVGLSDLASQASKKRRIDVNGTSGSLAYFSWLVDAGALAAALIVFERKRIKVPWVFWAVVGLTLIRIAQGVVAGSRSNVLLFGFILLAVWTEFGRKLTTRTLVIAAAAGILALSALGTLRAAQSNEITLNDTVDLEEITKNALSTHNWSGVEKTGIIIHRVPERWEFQNGKTMATAVVVPIPRQLWPGKPVVRVGPELGDRLFDLGRDRRTGLPPGLPGELYLNFGWLGIPVGGLLFGAVMFFARQKFLRLPSDHRGRLLWFIIILELGVRTPGGDLSGQMTVIFMTSVILFGWGFLASGRFRSTESGKSGRQRVEAAAFSRAYSVDVGS